MELSLDLVLVLISEVICWIGWVYSDAKFEVSVLQLGFERLVSLKPRSRLALSRLLVGRSWGGDDERTVLTILWIETSIGFRACLGESKLVSNQVGHHDSWYRV